jgi:hypothetical protein
MNNDVITNEELEKRMRPGQWSRFGFLGANEAFAEVISHDKQVLEEMGVTSQQIADAIEKILVLADD